MKLFYRLTPHSRLGSNPLFAHEMRRVRHAESAKSLIDYSILIIAAACAVLLLVWLVFSLADRQPDNNFSATDLLAFLFGISLLAAVALDYHCMTTSVGSINSEISAGRWDLLRLTTLESQQIVAAKYGAAQLRVWRVMALVVALRIAVVLMAGATTVTVVVSDWQSVTTLDMPLPAFLLLIFTAAACAAFYVVEPFWRMRTVTALGLAVSARVGHTVSSVVFAVGALGVFWLAQGFVAFALLLLVGLVIAPLASVEVVLMQGVICSPVLFLALVGITVYGFYSVVHTWGIRRALRFTVWLDLSEPSS